MIDTTFQIELINNVEHIQDSNVFTTVIPPMERVKSFSPDQFEEFILEWVISCAKTKYKDVYRIGGVGDMGRGVIGEYRNGEYDYYQCKRYDGKLNPSEYWVEFGKLCYYTYHKDMRMPKKYYIIVSREYYANCCEKCDVLQGDFYVFQEVDSPFFIENEDIARNLKLYRMPLKYDIIVDYTEESIGANDYMIKKYGKMLNVELY